MALTFDSAFENKELKNQSLAQEIAGLKRFITPDDELLDGQDMIGYRLVRETESIAEITETLKNETYKNSDNSEAENNKIKEELLAQIQEHKKDIQKLEKQREEIPKAIARLERMQAADPRDMATLTISEGTSRNVIKNLLNGIEARLQQTKSDEEKRVLIYFQGHLETIKTTLDTGKQVGNVHLFVHQAEFKYLGKMHELKEVHIDMTKHLLVNVLHDLRTEQTRLQQNGSDLHRQFAEPIIKIEERVQEMNHNRETVADKRKMLETMTVVDKLSMDLQAEKTVNPSFKDRLRSFVNNFRSFLSNTFGIKTSEPESLRSKTMTNMFKMQQDVAKIAHIAASKSIEREDPKRPRM
jgi:hypothetical protein